MRPLLLLVSLLLLVAGCYRLGDNDDLRAIPTTNNPYVIPQKGEGIPPAASY